MNQVKSSLQDIKTYPDFELELPLKDPNVTSPGCKTQVSDIFGQNFFLKK